MPLPTVLMNVKVPLPVTARLLPPLSCRVTVSDGPRPDTIPPTEYALVVQVTVTLVTSEPIAPVPLVTVHVWLGFVGWVSTVTAYCDPPWIAVANVKDPSIATVRSSPMLSCRTTIDPAASPATVPPTVYVAAESPPPEVIMLSPAAPLSVEESSAPVSPVDDSELEESLDVSPGPAPSTGAPVSSFVLESAVVTSPSSPASEEP